MKPFRWRDQLHLIGGFLAAVFFTVYACCAGSGCAVARGLFRTGIECSPGTVTSVQNAIEHGGASWVSAVLSAVQCIPMAIKNIDDEKAKDAAKLGNASMEDYMSPIETVQRRERRMMAEQLYREAK